MVTPVGVNGSDVPRALGEDRGLAVGQDIPGVGEGYLEILPLGGDHAHLGLPGCPGYRAGLLVPPPENVEVLTEAILTLLENRDLASSMGARGRELAQVRFSWQHYLACLSNLYERILAGEQYIVRRAA